MKKDSKMDTVSLYKFAIQEIIYMGEEMDII